MKRTLLILALLLGLAFTLQVLFACSSGDDDDNDTSADDDATDDDATDDDATDDDAANAPSIPHGDNGADCLGCHASMEGFPHGSTYTNDDCLTCHQYE